MPSERCPGRTLDCAATAASGLLLTLAAGPRRQRSVVQRADGGTQQARVHGLDGLRVVDASIMPEIPCSNTNLPTLMLAERVADLIRRRASGRDRQPALTKGDPAAEVRMR
jgi:choline dehydrogenase-like flavoprotein